MTSRVTLFFCGHSSICQCALSTRPSLRTVCLRRNGCRGHVQCDAQTSSCGLQCASHTFSALGGYFDDSWTRGCPYLLLVMWWPFVWILRRAVEQVFVPPCIHHLLVEVCMSASAEYFTVYNDWFMCDFLAKETDWLFHNSFLPLFGAIYHRVVFYLFFNPP